jgi:hypothetical protein
MQTVKRVHERERAGTLEAEMFIANVARQLPAGYHDGLLKRSQQAQKRLYIFRQLERLISEGTSESQIIKAWEQLGKIRGRILAGESVRERVQLAEARLIRLEQLRQLPAGLDPAERERRVLEIWDPMVMEGCLEAEEWSDVYRRVGDRREQIQLLEQAVQAGDLRQTEQLLKDPRLREQPLPPELARQIHELREQTQQAAVARRQAIVNTLLDNQRRTFVELFDAAVVADICRQYRHHQPVVSQWLEADILPAAKIGFSADPAAVSRDESGMLTIRWNWPPARITDHCHVRICRKPPLPHAAPEDVPAVHSVTITSDQWDPEQGVQIPMEADWERCQVYVWAVVDLGFQRFTSEPFLLGEIKPLPKQRRWSLFGRNKKAAAPEGSDGETGDPRQAATPGGDSNPDSDSAPTDDAIPGSGSTPEGHSDPITEDPGGESGPSKA